MKCHMVIEILSKVKCFLIGHLTDPDRSSNDPDRSCSAPIRVCGCFLLTSFLRPLHSHKPTPEKAAPSALCFRLPSGQQSAGGALASRKEKWPHPRLMPGLLRPGLLCSGARISPRWSSSKLERLGRAIKTAPQSFFRASAMFVPQRTTSAPPRGL